jgi:large subunit ribosomal protein L22
MQVKSIQRNVRISAFKAREVTRAIQGLPATDAMNLLEFVPKKAATLVRKTLASAIANAENNNGANPEVLTVLEAVVGEGPTMKRFVPKARGSAGPILKRTSHIRVVVTDEVPIERREKSPAGKGKGARKRAGAKAAAPEAAGPSAPEQA